MGHESPEQPGDTRPIRSFSYWDGAMWQNILPSLAAFADCTIDAFRALPEAEQSAIMAQYLMHQQLRAVEADAANTRPVLSTQAMANALEFRIVFGERPYSGDTGDKNDTTAP